jgi:hypothetical protein
MDLHEVLASEQLVMNDHEKDLLLTVSGSYITVWKGDGKGRNYLPRKVVAMPWVGTRAFLLRLVAGEK